MGTISVDLDQLVTAAQKLAEAQAALVQQFETAIQAHIDETARTKRYADGFALAGYANSTIPQFSAEALAFIAWRDQVWVYAYAELQKVEDGLRDVPTLEEFMTELPVMEWPEVGA